MKTEKNLTSDEVIVAKATQGDTGGVGEHCNFIKVCVIHNSLRNRFACYARHKWGDWGSADWKDLEGYGNTAEEAVDEIAADLFDSEFCEDDEFPHPYMRRQLLRDIRDCLLYTSPSPRD